MYIKGLDLEFSLFITIMFELKEKAFQFEYVLMFRQGKLQSLTVAGFSKS